ncbi:MAG TPA: glucose-6-phosphate isomerase, partial [Oligoflexia bacterium]|nr:glucose-6-phosphate isomerase [Oligoflexia bacterium]
TDYCKGSGPASYMEVEPAITSGDYLTGFYLGTQKALAENGRASMTITLDELTPFTLGALIALYERAVGLYAALINVNAYHQPGVEAGKKAAAQVIAIQRRIFAELQKQRGNSSGFSVVEIADKIGADAEFETVYKILEHLAANPARQIKRLGARDPQTARYVMT